jgi:2-hydroxy-3-keto-5-methylthiopentenyl-1-phosphate phosphatase
MGPEALVLDFDGTITLVDAGDLVCDRFAPPGWRALDRRWQRGELSLAAMQQAVWPQVRGTQAEILAFVRERASFRPGLDALLAAARARAIAVTIASGGFDFYIRVLLGERLRDLALYCNRGLFSGDGIRIEHSHLGTLSCERCAVCKGRVIERLRKGGAASVTFAGDGHSDRCAAPAADARWAVRGSPFERACRELGLACRSFEDLSQIAENL